MLFRSRIHELKMARQHPMQTAQTPQVGTTFLSSSTESPSATIDPYPIVTSEAAYRARWRRYSCNEFLHCGRTLARESHERIFPPPPPIICLCFWCRFFFSEFFFSLHPCSLVLVFYIVTSVENKTSVSHIVFCFEFTFC